MRNVKKLRAASVSLLEIRPSVHSGSLENFFMDAAEQAAKSGAELICLPETFSQTHLSYAEVNEQAEGFGGKFMQRMMNFAKQNKCHLLASGVIRVDNLFRNASILIDDKGKIAGYYFKYFPTVPELQRGIVPGMEMNVIEGEFGKLGATICFDMWYPDTVRQLANKGAKIIAFSSMFDGGFLLRAAAYRNGVFMVSAVINGTGKIIDPLGNILAESSMHDPVAIADISLDYDIFSINSLKPKMPAIRKAYGDGIEIKIMGYEDRGMLCSYLADKSALDIAGEFQLETAKEYLAACASQADAARK